MGLTGLNWSSVHRLLD